MAYVASSSLYGENAISVTFPWCPFSVVSLVPVSVFHAMKSTSPRAQEKRSGLLGWNRRSLIEIVYKLDEVYLRYFRGMSLATGNKSLTLADMPNTNTTVTRPRGKTSTGSVKRHYYYRSAVRRLKILVTKNNLHSIFSLFFELRDPSAIKIGF